MEVLPLPTARAFAILVLQSPCLVESCPRDWTQTPMLRVIACQDHSIQHGLRGMRLRSLTRSVYGIGVKRNHLGPVAYPRFHVPQQDFLGRRHRNLMQLAAKL